MPFLRNAWYVASYSGDLTDKPRSLVMLNERVALFRDSTGRVAAIRDRCPHRFVRLSGGRVLGDALQCPYHGLEFDRTGACVKQPFDEGQPAPHNPVKSYPATERYNYVWVWMGDPAKADPALIPDMPFIEDPDFVFVRGYLPYKGNYQFMADNVLDLTHVDILHQSVRCEDGFNNFEKKVEARERSLTTYVWKRNTVPSLFQLSNWGSGATRADVHSHLTWFAPCNFYHENGLQRVGEPERSGMVSPTIHMVTPETETSSHYWWVSGRNTRTDDDELTALMQETIQAIFRNEDVWMIEQQQEGLGDTADYLGQRPVILSADGALMQARRILARLIAQEQKDASAPAAKDRQTEPA